MKSFKSVKERKKYNATVPEEMKRVFEFWSWLRYLKVAKNDPLYKDYIIFYNQCIAILVENGLSLDSVPGITKIIKKKKGIKGDESWITTWQYLKDNYTNLEDLKTMTVDQNFFVQVKYDGRIEFLFKDDEELLELKEELYGS